MPTDPPDAPVPGQPVAPTRPLVLPTVLPHHYEADSTPTAVREGRLTSLDWEELEARAANRQVVVLVREALESSWLVYIREMGRAPVPLPGVGVIRADLVFFGVLLALFALTWLAQLGLGPDAVFKLLSSVRIGVAA